MIENQDDHHVNVDFDERNVVAETNENFDLKRGLQARHLTMIAIGGTIGTGLFLGSGASIAQAGPGGALISYLVIGVMVFFMMSSLGEMATYLPISGSFNTYAKRFVDPALGFALGWNYWYSWATTIALEITAGAIVMQFWFPDVPSWVWSLILLFIMLSLNLFSVKGYGEAEYWFAMIKVITVILFIFVGILLDIGAIGKPKEYIGSKNFDHGTFHNGFKGLLSVFLVAGFSFQGTELVGIAAGESARPEKNVPKAIKQVFWRILLFYVLAILVVGLLVAYDNPNLLGNSQDVSVSPFTLAFKLTGFVSASHFMNAVILTTVLSAGNSALYAASRVLYNLALEGQAPQILTRVTKNGVPLLSLLVTAFIGCLAFLMSLYGEGKVYIWLINLSGVSGFIQWAGISFIHWRFRRAYVAQERPLEELAYRAKLYPFGPIFACTLTILVILGQGYSAFTSENGVDAQAVVAAYIGPPVFIALFLVYKFVKKTKIVPLLECDFDTGRRKLEEKVVLDIEEETKFWGKISKALF
ncbi:10511_t:CDS:2 [Ambispora leptoticha]|uniref:10511_t:CDS:1 n=1 Tax=Ambispora leptoticha TaxID=144679 RepID=A0A9N9ASP1_9GLOM|nr:10511_t:CDS:2 [Ambispora leptoticha]